MLDYKTQVEREEKSVAAKEAKRYEKERKP